MNYILTGHYVEKYIYIIVLTFVKSLSSLIKVEFASSGKAKYLKIRVNLAVYKS